MYKVKYNCAVTGLLRTTVAAVIAASCLSCGASKKNAEGDSLGAAVSSSKVILGTWLLESISLKSDGLRVATTGTQTLTLRVNGSYFLAFEAFTSTISGVTGTSGCTEYLSGDWKLSNGNIQLSNSRAGLFSGNCYGNTGPAILTLTDEAKQVFSIDERQLNLVSPISYVDGQGRSQIDYVVSKYSRIAEDKWDGNGLDPRFQGSFKLKLTTLNYTCLASSDPTDKSAAGPLNMMGTTSLEVAADGTFRAAEIDSAIAGGPTCSGEVKGIFDLSDALVLRATVTSESADCVKGRFTSATSDGEIRVLERDITPTDKKWVQLSHSRYPNQNCSNGYADQQFISVWEKSGN